MHPHDMMPVHKSRCAEMQTLDLEKANTIVRQDVGDKCAEGEHRKVVLNFCCSFVTTNPSNPIHKHSSRLACSTTSKVLSVPLVPVSVHAQRYERVNTHHCAIPNVHR